MEPKLGKHICCIRLFLFFSLTFLYILYHNFVEKSKIVSPIPTKTLALFCTDCADKVHPSA